MPHQDYATEMVNYLESLRKRARERDTKTQRVELTFAETPAKLTGGWMPTDSGSGRLATGGKTFADSPGKTRIISAPVNMHGVKKSFQPPSPWINRNESFNTGHSQTPNANCSILGGINVPEPNQTIFSKILPFKRTIYSADKCNNVRNKRYQSAKVQDFHPINNNNVISDCAPKEVIHYKISAIPDSIYENKIRRKNVEIYKKTSQDHLKKFLKEYVEKNKNGARQK
ncbi:hypothetical protein ILUMI_20694 [Ignelater luminosus]|uniref:Uncharacterized protein n=1 Tax=Ignelater luminosus TaxID=2038154 RepID=A0A8K0CH00_IGNLU|nr:hypothetical protein ILUMI_20694 [Ignelater luminosus]